MTAAEAKIALGLIESDGFGAKTVWVKQADGSLIVANRIVVETADSEYYPEVESGDVIVVIEGAQAV